MPDSQRSMPPKPGDADKMSDGELLSWAAFYVAACWTPEGVRLWWGRQRTELDHLTPADAVLEGRIRDVYNLAEGSMGQVAT